MTTSAVSANSRMTAISNQTGFITTRTFNRAGLLVSELSPKGYLTTNTYDSDYRQTGVVYGDGTLVTLGYDAVGNRTTMADSTGITTYAYDPASRMVGKTDPGNLVQAYGYDLASQRISLTDPDGGIRSFSYDLDSRLVTVAEATGGVVSFQYDTDSRETTMVLSSGVTRKTAYDAIGQVVSLVDTNTSAAILQQFGFAYDGVGNRTVVTDGAGAWTTYTWWMAYKLLQCNRDLAMAAQDCLLGGCQADSGRSRSQKTFCERAALETLVAAGSMAASESPPNPPCGGGAK